MDAGGIEPPSATVARHVETISHPWLLRGLDVLCMTVFLGKGVITTCSAKISCVGGSEEVEDVISRSAFLNDSSDRPERL